MLTDLVACGVDQVGWSGGEPLLVKELESLTAFGADAGLSFGLVTNGYFASYERLKALSSAGVRVIQVSLDGATEESSQRYRKGPQGAFARAVKAISDSVSLGIKTYVCTILSPETAREVLEMVELTLSLRADGLRYSIWAPFGRASGGTYDERAWGGESLAEFLGAVRKLQETGFSILTDCPTGPYPGNEVFRCVAGPSAAYVTANGDVYPCTGLMYPEYLAGNVRQRPIAEILYGAEIGKMQRDLALSLPGGSCAGCPQIHRCRGGCPGRSLAQYPLIPGEPNHKGMPACLLRLHK